MPLKNPLSISNSISNVRNKPRSHIKTLFTAHCSLFIVLLIGSCDLWMKPMSDFIRDATSEAMPVGEPVIETEVNLNVDTKRTGETGKVTAIPVGKDTKIRIDFRNPQGYELELWFEGFVNGIEISKDAPSANVSIDASFKQYAIVTITNPSRLDYFDLAVTGTFGRGRPIRGDAFQLPLMEARWFDTALSSVTVIRPDSTPVGLTYDSSAYAYTADSNLKRSIDSVNVSASVPSGVFSSSVIIGADSTGKVNLPELTNKITITVTADSGIKRDYTITINKDEYEFTVSFNGNSNTSGTAPSSISQDGGLDITLPGQGTLARTGYTFGGWNTQDNGEGIDYAAEITDYTVTSSHTLYAKWEANDYNITVSPSIVNGDVATDKNTANYGDTITITAAPDSGYSMTSISVTVATGGTITPSLSSPGNYTFSMPASNVTISATFTPILVTNIALASATSVTVGNTLTLTATVTPADALNTNVTWSIASGTAYASLSGNVLSATAAGTVTVRASSVDGNCTRDFTITVVEKINAQQPVITVHPQSATYTVGDTVTALSVTATSPDGGTLSYQWYSNTTDSNSGGSVIDGATNSTYTPSAVSGTAYYYVVVTNTIDDNEDGGTKTASATSNTAMIKVNAPGIFNIELEELVHGSDPVLTGGTIYKTKAPYTLTINLPAGFEDPIWDATGAFTENADDSVTVNSWDYAVGTEHKVFLVAKNSTDGNWYSATIKFTVEE